MAWASAVMVQAPSEAAVAQQADVRLLYCSVLTAREHTRLLAAKRKFVAERHITGLLVFDGERLCEYLEGPAHAMQPMAQRIEADPRHQQVQWLLSGPLQGPRLFKHWQMGFAEVEHAQPMDDIIHATGEVALQRFLALSRHIECL
jgi:hypothetical protein